MAARNLALTSHQLGFAQARIIGCVHGHIHLLQNCATKPHAPQTMAEKASGDRPKGGSHPIAWIACAMTGAIKPNAKMSGMM
jgi:hypothetical protein